MKLLAGVRALSLAVLSAVLPINLPAAAQPSSSAPIAGDWQGTATIRGSEGIPLTIRITGSGSELHLALLNGPAAHPEEAAASSVTFDGSHLVATYDYYARTIDATLKGDTLSGTYGTRSPNAKAAPIPFTVKRVPRAADPAAAPDAPDISGSWEMATISAKGETAWEFRVQRPVAGTQMIRSVIQRVDGDTGALWGVWNGREYRLGHFTAANAMLYSVTPESDGTLLVKNLIPPAPKNEHATAKASAKPDAPPQTEWIARQAQQARDLNLPKPADPTQQTSVKDPSVPFAFSFPDLAGKTVSNTDPEFRGKVVIVALGGSWCPNCHDEAPFLVSLYRKYHAKGLEIVGLDFEQGDPESDTPRLKAFIRRYGIPYPMLTAGNTDEVEQKIPQGVNLNCWPTSFFLGRDGRVVEVHAGFAGPANPEGHAALERETTALVERLLAQKAPGQTAAR